MTREAANSLLKTLEEPPEYAILILLTSNESKLLNTIKSRCMKINFKQIPNEQIIEYLKQKGIDTNNFTQAMVKVCCGSIGKALKIEEEKDQYLQIEELVKKMQNQNITQIWKQAEILYSSKDKIIPLLEYIIIIFYEKLKKENKICYANAIEIIEQTKQRILANANYDMSIDNMLLKIWEELF